MHLHISAITTDHRTAVIIATVSGAILLVLLGFITWFISRQRHGSPTFNKDPIRNCGDFHVEERVFTFVERGKLDVNFSNQRRASWATSVSETGKRSLFSLTFINSEHGIRLHGNFLGTLQQSKMVTCSGFEECCMIVDGKLLDTIVNPSIGEPAHCDYEFHTLSIGFLRRLPKVFIGIGRRGGHFY